MVLVQFLKTILIKLLLYLKQLIAYYITMEITNQNVATKFRITCQEQDEFAVKSFAKALQAQQAGKFKEEIVPVEVTSIDLKSGDEKDVMMITAKSLGKLKSVFSKTGSTHAGKASQISDGAAAVLLAGRSVAKKLTLPILGKFYTLVVIGVPPKIMGIGPFYAIKLL
ncbi:hypothetical protein CROQUDRAFT_697960 [Cronartium quercuum f. sp. fusiforme G11]|uniref:Thiolase N-terminal domain-containing protein n=1 Tax=Cronartium quercuum f. sp. fusiforme G11 TaxID=708437 RepID=A0A9P6NII9_9BASI|nr:hypothetical protein CROQUDRAFT_697960 [Cronartium quercuum f. sp. fusiforme G11]